MNPRCWQPDVVLDAGWSRAELDLRGRHRFGRGLCPDRCALHAPRDGGRWADDRDRIGAGAKQVAVVAVLVGVVVVMHVAQLIRAMNRNRSVGDGT